MPAHGDRRDGHPPREQEKAPRAGGSASGAAAISTGFATRALQHAQAVAIDADTFGRTAGNNLTRQVTCNHGHLTVDGNENVVTVNGHCVSLTLEGIDNTVTLDGIDTITVSGIDGHVTYHAGTPTIANSGIDNTISRR